MYRCLNLPNPALDPVQTFPISPSNKDNTLKHTNTNIAPLDLSRIPSSQDSLFPLSQSQFHILPPQTHIVYTKIQKLSIKHNIPLAFLNHTSWAPQRDPPVPLYLLPREKWDENQFSLTVVLDKHIESNTDTNTNTTTRPVWIDLIVNNLDEEGHPFHLVRHLDCTNPSPPDRASH